MAIYFVCFKEMLYLCDGNKIIFIKNKKRMKKYFSMLLVLAMCFVACDGKKSKEKNEDSAAHQGPVFVDLGLPSGTKWKAVNEEGYYDYDAAAEKYGAYLPTKEQFQELIACCSWEWNGEGYVVKGANGNSILLPAAGCRLCDGDVYGVGTYGYYWSSSPDVSDYAWRLFIYSGGVDRCYYFRCNGQSVRLIQN